MDLDNTLGDPTGLVVGATNGVVVVGKEAFESVGPGYGVQLFIGSAFSPIDELRAGVSLSTHPDELSDDRVHTLSIYIESYFAADVSGLTVRIGPRFAWIHESRAIFVTKRLRGFGAGGVAAVQLLLGSRIAIETGAAVTLFRFGAADIDGGPTDPDRQSYGLVWDLRIGVAYRLK